MFLDVKLVIFFGMQGAMQGSSKNHLCHVGFLLRANVTKKSSKI